MAASKHALVPIVGADGDIRWQDWTYGELTQHLNNDLTLDVSTLDIAALGNALKIGQWIPVSPLSGAWVNSGGSFAPTAYLKDALGFVHLKGLVSGGVAGTAVFTLPAGYIPAEHLFYGAGRGSLAAGGAVEVQSNGAVLAWPGGADSVGLEAATPWLAAK